MTLRKGKCLLADIRKKRGWTQQQLVDQLRKKPYEIDISVATISKYETNKKPIPDVTRKALALIFKRPMDDFYEYMHE